VPQWSQRPIRSVHLAHTLGANAIMTHREQAPLFEYRRLGPTGPFNISRVPVCINCRRSWVGIDHLTMGQTATVGSGRVKDSMEGGLLTVHESPLLGCVNDGSVFIKDRLAQSVLSILHQPIGAGGASIRSTRSPRQRGAYGSSGEQARTVPLASLAGPGLAEREMGSIQVLSEEDQ
jgi:hypothetical protein